MNCLLLKGKGGEVGLAFLEEKRRVQEVFFSAGHIRILFEGVEEEAMGTPVDPFFHDALGQQARIFIGHFIADPSCEDPILEYEVPLTLSVTGRSTDADAVPQERK